MSHPPLSPARAIAVLMLLAGRGATHPAARVPLPRAASLAVDGVGPNPRSGSARPATSVPGGGHGR